MKEVFNNNNKNENRLGCRLRLSSSRWFCVGVSNNNNNSNNKKKNHRIMIDSSSSSSTTLISSSSSSSTPLTNITTTIDEYDDVYKYENYYSHYLHSHSFNPSRWSSRESYEYMLNRGWQQVVHFYSSILFLPSPPSDDHHHHHHVSTPTTTPLSFSSIFLPSHQKQKKKPIMPDIQSFCEEDAATTKHLSSRLLSNSTDSLSLKHNRGGRWDRLTFKILLSYLGSSFHGWQKQPGLNTVQRSVEETLGRFVDEMKAEQLRGRGLPVQGTAVVAGRTDKGVSALHQVCSFYTWRKDVKPQHIIDAFGEGEQGKLRIVSVSEVSRVFHPNFCAKWRRYLYIFPFNDGEVRMEQKDADGKDIEGCLEFDESTPEISKKPMKFEISKVNELLSQLEGKLLSYKIFARDTKASRSTGPPTECFMFHARAAEARLPSSVEDGKCTKAMCVELVANRFLRKMVRVLVATAIREAAAGAEEDALIKLMDATCRRATAPPAPPEGLCLVDVGYDEFDPSICYV